MTKFNTENSYLNFTFSHQYYFHFITLPVTFPFFFFFNDTATTEIYTLSLHDALPISDYRPEPQRGNADAGRRQRDGEDRKSTRLNSSHEWISYAVFCLKKKTKNT